MRAVLIYTFFSRANCRLPDKKEFFGDYNYRLGVQGTPCDQVLEYHVRRSLRLLLPWLPTLVNERKMTSGRWNKKTEPADATCESKKAPLPSHTGAAFRPTPSEQVRGDTISASTSEGGGAMFPCVHLRPPPLTLSTLHSDSPPCRWIPASLDPARAAMAGLNWRPASIQVVVPDRHESFHSFGSRNRHGRITSLSMNHVSKVKIK